MERIDIILKVNSSLVRKRLEDAGLKVCLCCAFDQAVWLHCCNTEMEYDIHGVGYPHEEMDLYKVEEVLNQFISESGNIIDCDFDVDKFIERCIKLKGI